jgi:hypothetical protein
MVSMERRNFLKAMGARLRSSFPHAPGGNPGSSSSLDPRQEHAGVTEWTLSCSNSSKLTSIPAAMSVARAFLFLPLSQTSGGGSRSMLLI